MPRGAAHTLDLDAPLVLSVELVREDRDSGAFAIGLGQVGDSLGLFLASPKNRAMVMVVPFRSSSLTPAIAAPSTVFEEDVEDTPHPVRHEESGRRQRACADPA